MEFPEEHEEPIDRIGLTSSIIGPTQVLEIIKKHSNQPWTTKNSCSPITEYRSLDGRYLITHKKDCNNDSGNGEHIEEYCHEEDLMILSKQEQKLLEYYSSQEWEEWRDGFSQKTDDRGVVRVYEKDELVTKVCEELEQIQGKHDAFLKLVRGY